MEKEKRSTKRKKTRTNEECSVPDEQRCKRTDGAGNWQCKNARVNHMYCQHHINLGERNYLVKKEMRKAKEHKKSTSVKDAIACPNREDTTQAVGISKWDINNLCLIRNPEIAEKIMVPTGISDMSDLLPNLLMEAWNEELTPVERISLRILLPGGQRDNAAVVSILSGGTSRFGIDHAGQWCKSVCEGKENPDAVLEREMDLKILQSEYLKDLELYKEGLIDKTEMYKRLWFEKCKGDEEKFFEILGKYKSDPSFFKL